MTRANGVCKVTLPKEDAHLERKWYRLHWNLYLTEEQAERLQLRAHEFVIAGMNAISDNETIFATDGYMGDLEEE